MNTDKNYSKKGFTLMEAMVALLIMGLIVNIAVLSIKSAQQKANQDFEVKLEEVVQDLESPKHGFRLVAVDFNKLTLYSEVEKKRYYLSCYTGHDMLRYTPGHMPLMLGVQTATFYKKGNLIQIKITTKQEKSTAYAFIPPAKES